MLSVISKGHIPLIDEFERNRMQEFLDGTHPLSSKRKDYDTGTSRPTMAIPMSGRDEIKREPDDVGAHDDVSSGYNEGLDPGGRADDETGPGNTSIKPETDPNQISRMWMTEDEVSNFLFRNEESNKLDQQSHAQLYNVFRGQSYGPPPRKEHGKWQHAYRN